MTKSKKRRLEVIGAMIAFTSLIVLFFPLNNFVGAIYGDMHAIFALSHMQSIITPTPAPILPALIATPIHECHAIPDPNCLAEPSFVSSSNTYWVYYFSKWVYLEFPSTWRVQIAGPEQKSFYILPSPESPEGLGLDSLLFYAGEMSVEGKEQMDLHIFHNRRPGPIWSDLISLNDFQGVEFLVNDPSSKTILEIFLYDEKDQAAVYLIAELKDDQTAALAKNPDAMNDVFPNIRHMVESVRIWKP